MCPPVCRISGNHRRAYIMRVGVGPAFWPSSLLQAALFVARKVERGLPKSVVVEPEESQPLE